MHQIALLSVFLAAGCAAQGIPQAADQPAAVPQGRHVTPQRKIIDRASLELRVASLNTLRSQLTAAVDAHEGYLESSQVQPALQSGHWTVRVPSSRYSQFLVECANWGTVLRTQQSAEDVTEQFIDLGARLATKRLEEERLHSLLTEQTGALVDVLAVEKELSRVREEIEQAVGRQRFLEQQTTYATVQISATELVQIGWVAQGSLASQIVRVLQDSCVILLTVLRTALLIAVALLPWFAVAAVPGLCLWRWVITSKREKLVTVSLRDNDSPTR